MYAETEGIVLKQTKIPSGRRMILLFSQKYGKISAGTGISERSKSRAALAMRPFTHGKYELFKSRDTYNMNGAEVLKAYFAIGEDVEKYMCASCALEFTEKLLPENFPSPAVFRLLLDFMDVIETRKKKHMTLLLAYQLKAMKLSGAAPTIDACVCCGTEENLSGFSIKDGGVVCGSCKNKLNQEQKSSLIYDLRFDIIKILKYFFENSIMRFENLALDDRAEAELLGMIRSFRAYHLDIGQLKSEGFLTNNIKEV